MDLTYPIQLYRGLKFSGDVAYYIDLYDAVPFMWDICQFDKVGVPKVDYGPERGVHRNKTFICQWGLANLNKYLQTKNPEYSEVYQRQIDWLFEHLEFAEGNPHQPLWYNHFDFVHQGQIFPGPWTGGLGHALAISLLIRDYRLRAASRSLELAKQLSWFLFLDVEKGGVLCREGNDLFLEEYNRPPFTRILDGFLYMLLAVYDLADVTGWSEAESCFGECVDTLERHLHRWDYNGVWSYYDIHGKQLANPAYHAMNYSLLEAVGKITNRQKLLETAASWQKFMDDSSLQGEINTLYFELLPASVWREYKDPQKEAGNV